MHPSTPARRDGEFGPPTGVVGDLSGKPDTNRLSETVLICRVAARRFHDPVQAGLQPSKWRCAGRARRSHPARSESRSSRLLCRKCSAAREKASPQAKRCATRGGASADWQTPASSHPALRPDRPAQRTSPIGRRMPSGCQPAPHEQSPSVCTGSDLARLQAYGVGPAFISRTRLEVASLELYWRGSEEERYATEIAGGAASRKAARGGRGEAPRLAAAWLAAAVYLGAPSDRLFQLLPGRPWFSIIPPVIGQDPRIRQATPRQRRLHSGRRVSLRQQHRGIVSAVDHLSYLLNYACSAMVRGPPGYHWVNLALHAINVGAGLCARHRDFRRGCAGMGSGRNLGFAPATHRIRNEYCGQSRPAGGLRSFGRIVVLRESGFVRGPA